MRLPRHVDPADLETLTLQPVTKGVLEYACPVCNNRTRSDIAGLEPCCTGPDPYSDDHPMEVMVLVSPERSGVVVGF